jgi:mannose-binding lectin 1
MLKGSIPFWEHSGSAIPSNDQIRLTPSIKSQKGRIWCKNQMTSENWEVEATLRIQGRGRLGKKMTSNTRIKTNFSDNFF